MPDDASQPNCVNRLKVLADPTRLAVIEELMASPKHVGQLTAAIGVEQSLMSHHLKILRDAGLVEAKRDGKSVRYELAHEAVAPPAGKTINLGCCRLAFDDAKPSHRASSGGLPE